MSAKYEKWMIQRMISSMRESRRDCEEIVEALEELEGVGDEAVGFYRGMAYAFEQMEESLSEWRKQL